MSWSESTRFSVVIDRVSRSVQKRAIHPEDVLRLATEAAALKVLSGVPGVVPLLSWDGQTLITQYIEGRPLLVAWKDWDVPTRRHIAISLLKSVAAIHARGVAHRDLSPDNILITADNQLFLIDFELARLKGHAHKGGTPVTAAPEVRWLPDPRLLDNRADTFSLGLLLGRLLLDQPWALSGEDIALRLCLPAKEVTGEASWIAAMTAPRRRDRPTNLLAFAQALAAGTQAVPQPAAPPERPEALSKVLEQLQDDIGETRLIALDLDELLPLTLGEEIPAESWQQWALDLSRAQALRAQAEGAARWEAIILELSCGIPWRILADAALGGAAAGPFAHLALSLAAPHTARMALGNPGELVDDGIRLALYAAAESRLGRTVETSLAVSGALRRRPTDPAGLWVYWGALTRALLYSGAIADLIQFISLLPKEERAPAIQATLPALSNSLRDLASRRDHLVHRAGPLSKFVAIALGSTIREIALVLSEIALWVVEARRADAGIANMLEQAGQCLAEEAPSDASGAILWAAGAHLAGHPDALKVALQKLHSLLPNASPPNGHLAQWVRRLLTPPRVKLPAWAQEAPTDSQAAEDERVPLALFAREGIDAALKEVEARLGRAPRSARLWNLTLQLWSTTASTHALSFEHAMEPLLDALSDAGMPPPVLLPWRMRMQLLCGRPKSAIESLGLAYRRHDIAWPAWLIAMEAWQQLGAPARVAEAYTQLKAAGAPVSILNQLRPKGVLP